MSSLARKRGLAAFGSGAVIGTLGGLVGLGGAEFRLPVLIAFFRFVALEAVILNKATSLVVVASALPFRMWTIPFAAVAAQWEVIVNLLAGSLLGAWVGASWATRLKSGQLYRIISILLLVIALVLAFGHDASGQGHAVSSGVPQMVIGATAGFAIGVIASLLGVAGGELLIPTLVLLFGLDIKLAGSLSLVISLPTMIVGFTRYSKDASFSVISQNWSFLLIMAVGSIVGTFIGALLLKVIPSSFIIPGLVAILIISAIKMWRHR